MTPLEYRAALATLGLSQLAAGRWLGVSNKTAQRYATTGPSGAAARAVGVAVALKGLDRVTAEAFAMKERVCVVTVQNVDGPFVRHADLSAALGLPAK